MPTVLVNSPFSGQPVKIRDQDVGRAVRDEAGRIFYAVPRSDGNGFYGSPTRHGSPKDEQRYLDVAAKGHVARTTGAERSEAQVHDASGRPRHRFGRFLLLLVLLLIALGAAWYYWFVVLGHEPPAFMRPLTHLVPRSGAGTSALAAAAPRVEPAPRARVVGHVAPRPLPLPPPPTPNATTVAAPRVAHTGARPSPPVARDRLPVPVSAPGPMPAGPEVPSVVSDASPLAGAPAEAGASPRAFKTTASGLRYRVDKPGKGPIATAGSFVVIDYLAMLPGEFGTAEVIDSTQDSGPVGFVLWSGQVIRGWDEGVAGMRVGEKRTLIVPPALVHAGLDRSRTAFPPHTTLQCVVWLRDVQPGVSHEVTRAGAGKVAMPGDRVHLHYTARIDGAAEPFDDSRSRGEVFTFRIGSGEVINGWELGVTGMAEAEVRRIVVPPYLAYGKRGFGALIPPDTTLVYEVELLRIEGR